MNKRLLIGAIAALAAMSPTALAADHQDAPTAFNDPSLDITDLYTWTDASGGKLNLVMDVVPQASKATSTFSNTGQYVFHVNSYASYGPPLGVMATDASSVICTFDTSTPQKVQCWLVVNGATADYATGNATATSGISSVNGDFTVFTGARQDPFFFNLDGFKATLVDVINTLPDLIDGGAFGPTGCPTIDPVTVGVLDTQLSASATGGPATDHFAGFDVLSIVVQVKTAAVTSTGHTVVGVWASTHI